MRNFRIDSVRFSVVNAGGVARYSVRMFSNVYGAWVTVGRCNTIADGHDVAADYMHIMSMCI